jgi:protein-S-isoprenylcysteine O-methyltransferase Ste14
MMTTTISVSVPATQDSRRRRPDIGRLLMVPFVTALLIANAARVVTTGMVDLDPVAFAGAALTAAFYALVLWAYARRSPARATSRHWPSHVAAVVASWSVFAFPLLPHGHRGQGVGIAADVFLLAGSAWSLWSLRTLGRSFSVLAQARSLVSSGPYRLVRHPLYLGEIVGAVGLALNVLSWWSIVTWTVLVGLQLYRSVYEERVLAAAIPEYGAYQSSTRRLLPGLV